MPYKNLKSLTVYQKALDLTTMSREIASFFAYNQDVIKLYESRSLRDDIAESIVQDANLIPEHLARAAHSDSNSARLKYVGLVQIMIRNILSYCNGLEHDGVKEKEYINLFRREIGSFRRSLNSWLKTIRLQGPDTSLGYNSSS